MIETEVISGQNLFDISSQRSGSISGVFALAALNGNRSITDDLNDGETIDGDIAVLAKSTYDYYTKREIKPGTAEKNGTEQKEGIGFDFIESPTPYTQPY